MMLRASLRFGCGVVLLATVASAQQPEVPASPMESNQRVAAGGASFIPNAGQWRESTIRFGYRTSGFDVAFRDSSIEMHFVPATPADPMPGDDLVATAEHGGTAQPSRDLSAGRIGVTFPGCRLVEPTGAALTKTRFNFYRGDDASRWVQAGSFRSIVYPGLYDGIDLEIEASDGGVLKYQFRVAPGVDPSPVCVQYDGVNALELADGGELLIHTPWGTLSDSPPLVWQEIDGERRMLPARFELSDASTYRFVVEGEVDPSLELIIDPDLTWMTYCGGTGTDEGWSIALDPSGASLLAGYTNSTDFEGHQNAFGGGALDAFVARVDADGRLDWVTFLGGSAADYGKAISTDADGNAFVTGYTKSPDFAGRINSQHGDSTDAFLTKVDPTGAVVWMRYLGGTGDDWVNDIAVDSTGAALIAGQTASSDFEGRTNQPGGGSADAFVVKVDSQGALEWMTYFGGSGWDSGRGIAVDDTGRAVVAGRTESADFRGRRNEYQGGRYDAFALKVNPLGDQQWMLYLGGSEWDSGGGIAVDGADNILAAGYSSSTDCLGAINLNHGDVDGMVTKITPTGEIRWTTYLGGSSGDSCAYIAVDSSGNSIMTGRTGSADFEGRNNSHHGGPVDAFVVKVDGAGALMWSTYLGGRGSDYGRGIAVDAADDALVGGFTSSPDFEGRGNSNHGDEDAFVAKVRAHDGPRLSVAATCPAGGPIVVEWSGCTPGGRAVLVFAGSRGTTIVPTGSACAGTSLGLSGNRLRIAFDGAAGANGHRVLQSTAAANACGGFLQLLDVNTCSTSNVATVE